MGHGWHILGNVLGGPKPEHTFDPAATVVRCPLVRVVGAGTRKPHFTVWNHGWLMRAQQCQYYGRKRSRATAIAMYVAAVAIFAGFEVGMIFAIFVGRLQNLPSTRCLIYCSRRIEQGTWRLCGFSAYSAQY